MRLRDALWLLASQTVNVLFFHGMPDESLSARAWREFVKSTPGWDRTHYRIDRWLGQGHCKAVFDLQQQREKARGA